MIGNEEIGVHGPLWLISFRLHAVRRPGNGDCVACERHTFMIYSMHLLHWNRHALNQWLGAIFELTSVFAIKVDYCCSAKNRIGFYGRLGWMDVNVGFSFTFFIRSTTTLINVYQSSNETQLIAARVVIDVKESWFQQKLTSSTSMPPHYVMGKFIKFNHLFIANEILTEQSCSLGLGMAIEVGTPCLRGVDSFE